MSPVKYQDHATSRGLNEPNRPRSRRARISTPAIESGRRTCIRIKSDQADVGSGLARTSRNKQECGCPTGNPSAAVRRAASGCHYTRDHLLSPRATPVPRESSLERERALARRTTIVRPESAGVCARPTSPLYASGSADQPGSAGTAGFSAAIVGADSIDSRSGKCLTGKRFKTRIAGSAGGDHCHVVRRAHPPSAR